MSAGAVSVAEVRSVVLAHAELPADRAGISDDDDLWLAGMDSLSSVAVMVAVEESFDIEFPDEYLTREVFGSVAAIAAAVREIAGQEGR